MKIVFIGNSYTYYNDLPVLFEKLSTENSQPAEVFSVTSGGRYLRQNLDSEDACTLKLRDLLSRHRFDVCVLQEQSTYAIRDKASFLRDMLRIAEFLTPNTDRFVLYATWGRQFGSKVLNELGMTGDTMAKMLHTAYSEAREAIMSATGRPTDVAPVGLAFASANSHPEADLYSPDLSHPSYDGSCLSAMVHYKTVFGNAPESVKSLGLSAEAENLFFQIV